MNLYFEEEMVEPLKEIISEEEFLNIFQKQTIELLKICVYLTEKEEKDFLFDLQHKLGIGTELALEISEVICIKNRC